MASKEPKRVVKVKIFGNNRWCGFFKVSGNDGEAEGQTGFFRIHRLFAESGADVKTKKLEQPSDLKDFVKQNEEKNFWARVVAYDHAGFDDCDSRHFKTEDGDDVSPQWRAEILWIGPEAEPNYKVRVFHVEHPETKVVKIELVPNSFLFKFELEGATEIGRLSADKVVVGGKWIPKFKLRSQIK